MFDSIINTGFWSNNSAIIKEMYSKFKMFADLKLTSKGKEGKVFYGQEPPSGESTTTECMFNYQLLGVIY